MDALGGLGYFVNEYAIADDADARGDRRRPGSRGRTVATGSGQPREDEVVIGGVLNRLAQRRLGLRFGDR